jgi:hypothetical protein
MGEPIITYRGRYHVVSQFYDPSYFSYTYSVYPTDEGMFYSDYLCKGSWTILGWYDTVEDAKRATINAWMLGISDQPDDNQRV